MGGANGPTMKQIGEYLYSRSDNVDSSDNSIVEGCGDDPTASAGGENPFRIYFQNICGLKLQKSKHTLVDVVGFLSSFGVALVGLAETNTNWKQFESKNQNTVLLHNMLGKDIQRHSHVLVSLEGGT